MVPATVAAGIFLKKKPFLVWNVTPFGIFRSSRDVFCWGSTEQPPWKGVSTSNRNSSHGGGSPARAAEPAQASPSPSSLLPPGCTLPVWNMDAKSVPQTLGAPAPASPAMPAGQATPNTTIVVVRCPMGDVPQGFPSPSPLGPSGVVCSVWPPLAACRGSSISRKPVLTSALIGDYLPFSRRIEKKQHLWMWVGLGGQPASGSPTLL